MKHVACIIFSDNSLAQAGQAENLSSTGQEIFTLSKKDKGTGLCSTVAVSTNQLLHIYNSCFNGCFLRMLHRHDIVSWKHPAVILITVASVPSGITVTRLQGSAPKNNTSIHKKLPLKKINHHLDLDFTDLYLEKLSTCANVCKRSH